MKDNSAVGIIIVAFVAILLGVIVVAIISDEAVKSTFVTSKSGTINIAAARTAGGGLNENTTFAVANGYDTWRRNSPECVPSTILVKNDSGYTATADTDYYYAPLNGTLRFRQTVVFNKSAGSTANTTTEVWTYCNDGYLTESWSRSVLNMAPGFFALGILVGAAFLIVWILRKEQALD